MAVHSVAPASAPAARFGAVQMRYHRGNPIPHPRVAASRANGGIAGASVPHRGSLRRPPVGSRLPRPLSSRSAAGTRARSEGQRTGAAQVRLTQISATRCGQRRHADPGVLRATPIAPMSARACSPTGESACRRPFCLPPGASIRASAPRRRLRRPTAVRLASGDRKDRRAAPGAARMTGRRPERPPRPRSRSPARRAGRDRRPAG